MVCVVARPNENIDSLLRRFKKSVEDSGILVDLKKYEFYEKPSVKKKRKQAAAKKRAAKKFQKAEQGTGKGKNKNFKWNEDHTRKILTDPPKKFVPRNTGVSPNKNKQNQSKGYTNRPKHKRD